MTALRPILQPVMQPVLRGVFDPPTRGSGGGGGGGGDDDPLLKAILDLYANGEEGALYYFTDGFAGLYQDAAGTTPVTAMGQPIGRIEDRSPNGLHATQATAPERPVLPVDGPPRLRSEWSEGVDDAISVTLPVDCEVWVNTPHGHYRARGAAGLFHLPLNDCTHFLAIGRELTPSERDSVAAYFGTPARWGCYLTPRTEVVLSCYSEGTEPDPVIHFAGENGVTVTKMWARDPEYTTIDLADDGLTAPVMVMPDAGYGSRYFVCSQNQFTGSIPDLSSNTALMMFQCSFNQLTGSISDLSANTELWAFDCQSNQLSGSIPDLPDNMMAFFCRSNQLTDSIPDLSGNTSLMMFACQSNQLTGSIPDLPAALEVFDCESNQLTGSIPDLSANTALTTFYCYSNQLTGSIPDLSANTALMSFMCNSNQLTGYTGGGLGTNTNDMQFQDNALTQAAVDLLLSDLVDAGHNGSQIWLHQGTNSPPSAQGMADVATLQSRGWDVQVNP